MLSFQILILLIPVGRETKHECLPPCSKATILTQVYVNHQSPSLIANIPHSFPVSTLFHYPNCLFTK